MTTVLMHRFLLFGLVQAIIAAGYAVIGNPIPWSASVAWWPITATLTNLASFTILSQRRARAGVSWARFCNVTMKREFVGRDLLTLLGILVVSAPIGYLPTLAWPICCSGTRKLR